MSEKHCSNCRYDEPFDNPACIDCSNYNDNKNNCLWEPVDNDKIIEHPGHYTFGKIEVIDVIEDWKLDWHRGNAIKYIARAPHKGMFLQDLKRAKWYIERKIKLLEKEKQNERPD